jgi:cyclophilin family peptidyl-prolyl cis-trans isomerase
MTRTLTTIFATSLALACGPKPPPQEPQPASVQTPAPKPLTATLDPAAVAERTVVTEKLGADALPANLYFNLQVEGFGLIVVKLYTKDAPENVANVANLAIEGFYDGLTFHRIIEGFVAQGGDPDGNGAGGLGYTVPAEIVQYHDKGCMAMARKPDDVNPKKENSSCQFYFCLENIHKLDYNYTVIGKIVTGLDVMEAIGAVDTDEKDMPLETVLMQKAWITTD